MALEHHPATDGRGMASPLRNLINVYQRKVVSGEIRYRVKAIAIETLDPGSSIGLDRRVRVDVARCFPDGLMRGGYVLRPYPLFDA